MDFSHASGSSAALFTSDTSFESALSALTAPYRSRPTKTALEKRSQGACTLFRVLHGPMSS